MSTQAAASQQARMAEQRNLHEERIVWLSGDAPTWVCGTPVAPSDRHAMLARSQQWLANPYA